MDITTAERALAQLVAQWSGLELDRTVLCGGGDVPAAAPLVQVRFIAGRPAGAESLADFVAEVRGSFAEPGEAQDFVAAVWGALPRYGVSGFADLDDGGKLELAERKGFFTAAGRVRARFA